MFYRSILLLISLIFGLYSENSWALDSSKYEEKGCAKPTPALNLNSAWDNKIAAWYVPMASTYFHHSWVEKLTNKSATPDSFKKLCLRFLYLASSKPNTPYMIAAGGFNKVVTFQCTSTNDKQQSCDGIPQTPGYEPGVETEDTITKTDNVNYMLMVSCIKNQLKSWYVMTPKNTEPSPAIMKDVTAAIKSLGFNAKQISYIAYATCPKTKS